MRKGGCRSSWASNCGYSHLYGILEGLCLVVGGLSNAAVHDKDDEVRLCLGGNLGTRKGAQKQTKLSQAQMRSIFSEPLGLSDERRGLPELQMLITEALQSSRLYGLLYVMSATST